MQERGSLVTLHSGHVVFVDYKFHHVNAFLRSLIYQIHKVDDKLRASSKYVIACVIFRHRHLSVITRSSKYNYQFLQFKLSMSNRLKSAGTFRGYRRRGRSRCPATERDKHGVKSHARQRRSNTQHAFVFLIIEFSRRFEIFYRVGNPNAYSKSNFLLQEEEI